MDDACLAPNNWILGYAGNNGFSPGLLKTVTLGVRMLALRAKLPDRAPSGGQLAVFWCFNIPLKDGARCAVGC